jgi:hypothetical protein
MIRPLSRRLLCGLSSLLLVLAAGSASALSFSADFVSSTYRVRNGDSFNDLLLRHQAGTPIQSNVTTGLENISTAVYASGVTQNYSLLMTTSFEVAVAGTYTFQVGTDWGRGGGAALIDTASGSVLSERVIRGDIWWNNDWNDADVFTTTSTFAVGDRVTLAWVGFEDCCGGTSTIRFSVDGSAFAALTDANFAPFAVTPIPEPSTAVLFGFGLIGLSLAGERFAR